MHSFGTNIGYQTTNPSHTPAVGQDILVVNVTNGSLWYFDGTLWRQFVFDGVRSMRNTFTLTDPYPASTALLSLSNSPINAASVDVWYDGAILHPSAWTLETTPSPRIRLEFETDPTLSADGISNKIYVRYAY